MQEFQTLQEYCLFWSNLWPLCLTKAEWAAWVQAIGTLATLAVAAWVVRYEIKQRRLDVVQQQSAALTARARLVRFLTEALLNFVKQAKLETELSNMGYCDAFNSLKLAAKRVESIDLIELPTKRCMFHLSAIHQDIATMGPLLSRIENSRPVAEELAVLERLLGRIEINGAYLVKEAERLGSGLLE